MTLTKPWKVMMLGLLGVAAVLSELMMAWRRLPPPLSAALLTVKVVSSSRPSRFSIASRRRRAVRRAGERARAGGTRAGRSRASSRQESSIGADGDRSGPRRPTPSSRSMTVVRDLVLRGRCQGGNGGRRY